MGVRQVNNIYENNSSVFRKVRLVLYTEQSKTELEFQGLVEDETYEPAGDYPNFSGTKISHLLIQTHTKWYSHKVPVEKTNSLMTFFG